MQHLVVAHAKAVCPVDDGDAVELADPENGCCLFGRGRRGGVRHAVDEQVALRRAALRQERAVALRELDAADLHDRPLDRRQALLQRSHQARHPGAPPVRIAREHAQADSCAGELIRKCATN